MFRRVLVAGIGALGSEVVRNLGLVGCESVLIADADVLEKKNVARSWLFRDETAVGRSKVSYALDRLPSLFSQTQWSGAPVEIADVEPEHFLKAEVLFSCVDTDLARAEIAALAARYNLPVCDGGLGGVSTRMGRVSWFPRQDTAACFACLLPNKRRAELFSAWESNIQACWAVATKNEPAWTSTPTMASIVAALQVEIAFDSLNKAIGAFSIHLDLDQAPLCRTIEHHPSADCPFHAGISGAPFPICTLAECRACGRCFTPNRRIAWVRRWGTCPSCKSRDIVIRESIRDELVECGS